MLLMKQLKFIYSLKVFNTFDFQSIIIKLNIKALSVQLQIVRCFIIKFYFTFCIKDKIRK